MWLQQLSYHNNHIPYVATANAKADCAAGKTCKPFSPSAGIAAADYTSMQASRTLPPYAIQRLVYDDFDTAAFLLS